MKKITIKEVAKEAGVSTATISRVLNNTGYVSEEARRTILETIERLNYRPNAIARSLKQDRSRMVGIVLPDMTNPYFMKLSRSLQKRLRESGLHGMFMDTYGDPDMELEALNGLMMMRVEAIVLAGTGRNVPAIRKMVRGSGIPFVLVDRKLPGVAADLAAEENEAAAYEAAADLAQRHEAIGILAGPDWISTARERLDGAAAALREAGVALPASYVFTGDLTRDSGREGMVSFLQLPEPPTAVFSVNNEMTFGLYLGLREAGKALDSIEVASFGDLEFSGLFGHRLSIVEQCPDEVGQAAAELLIRRLAHAEKGEGTESRTFVPTLVRKW